MKHGFHKTLLVEQLPLIHNNMGRGWDMALAIEDSEWLGEPPDDEAELVRYTVPMKLNHMELA